MTISVVELPAITKEDLDQQSSMLQRMRDLAKQAHNSRDDEQSLKWDDTSMLGQVTYEDWQTGTLSTKSMPWTITNGGTGSAGQISAIGSISGLSHANSSIYTNSGTSPWQTLTTTGTSLNIGSTNPSHDMTIKPGGKIEIQGKDADININGKSMNKWMEQVEQRLNILSPNPELEKEWDELRRLGERYKKLEKKCQEKAKMWDALKKLPKLKI
jgi:hypothetical protein